MNTFADRRRNLGPTDLVRVAPISTQKSLPLSKDIRPIFISQGIAAHASGSAYLESGNIKLHATVHGPRQLRGEFSENAEIEVNVSVSQFAGVEQQEDFQQSLSDFIRSSIVPVIVLKEYPKSLIVINLLVLNGGSITRQLAASVNVVIMALVNAGIALHDMVTAVSLNMVSPDEIFVDSDVNVNSESVKQLVASYSVATNKLVSMLVTSQTHISKNELVSLLDRAYTAARTLREILNSFLVEDYVKKSTEKISS